MMKEEEIKEHLMSSSPEYRRLAEEHHHYEEQLQQLHSRHMTEHDHVEEVRLKKKKLQLKDQMNSMVQKHRGELSHQHS
jgi:uncharacterized protein